MLSVAEVPNQTEVPNAQRPERTKKSVILLTDFPFTNCINLQELKIGNKTYDSKQIKKMIFKYKRNVFVENLKIEIQDLYDEFKRGAQIK